jgi:hypothetical protein
MLASAAEVERGGEIFAAIVIAGYPFLDFLSFYRREKSTRRRQSRPLFRTVSLSSGSGPSHVTPRAGF